MSAHAPSTAALDPDSRAWVECLSAPAPRIDECVPELHALLVRVARHEVSRRAGALRLRGPELDDLAQQAANDALMAIRAKVPGFRGESRFTTWAYRFVMLEVSTKMARHFWRDRAPSTGDGDPDLVPDPAPASPDRRAEDREMLRELRRAIEADLTPLQRHVFVAAALNEAPIDALALELGSNRNAVYKTLFDARRKLRASLSAAGYATGGGA